MTAVVAVEAKGDKAAILIMGDGSRVWTPERAKAEGLVGKPIPADWTQKQGEYGPQAFPPREGKGPGGKPAWANTEEGERFVQERMDRRTALMQAVAVLSGGQTLWVSRAEEMYAWLRAPLESVSAPSVAGSVSGGADTPPDGGDGTEYPRGTASGKASPSPSSPTHDAKWTPRKNEPEGWR